jgi:hypothetical protein
MYFFYFSIINMFSFFPVFYKLFLIEQERQILEMLQWQALQAESTIFGRSKQTMTGWMDDRTNERMDDGIDGWNDASHPDVLYYM